MSVVRLFAIIISFLVGTMNPFLAFFTLSTKDEVVEEQPVYQDIIEIEDANSISGFIQHELDGYATLQIPASHFSKSETDENTNILINQVYKDGMTKFTAGFVTKMPEGTDILGYIVQKAAGVDTTTNDRQTVTYKSGDWTVVNAKEQIDGFIVRVYFQVGPDGNSACWMRVKTTANTEQEELNEAITAIIDSYSCYYIGYSIFDTPTTGYYADNQIHDPSAGDTTGYDAKDDDNQVFGDRGGFSTGYNITNDWRNLEIFIDDYKIVLPCYYDNLTEAGFYIIDGTNAELVLGPSMARLIKMMNKEGAVISVMFVNQSTIDRKLENCIVNELTLDVSNFLTTDSQVGSDDTGEATDENGDTTESTNTEPVDNTEEGSDDSITEGETENNTSADDTPNANDSNPGTKPAEKNNEEIILAKHKVVLAKGVNCNIYVDDLTEAYGPYTFEKGTNEYIFRSGSSILAIRTGKIRGIYGIHMIYSSNSN